ncbi:hypothetical protein MKZ25_13255 [Solibacillus sp. FSL W7-1464]
MILKIEIGGVSFGMVLAIIISWSVNKSVLWAIIHGLFGWLYVIYYVLTI